MRTAVIAALLAVLAGCAPARLAIYRTEDASAQPAVLYVSKRFSVRSVDGKTLPTCSSLVCALAPPRPHPLVIYLGPGMHEIRFTWRQDFSGLRYATRTPATLLFSTRSNTHYVLTDRPRWGRKGLARVRFIITRSSR